MLLYRYLVRACALSVPSRPAVAAGLSPSSSSTVVQVSKYHQNNNDNGSFEHGSNESESSSSSLTYSLGSNPSCLYVPITSYCNTRSLPETRGPNFFLPSTVVASLCRLRDTEQQTEQWKHYYDCCNNGTGGKSDTKKKLPERPQSMLSHLSPPLPSSCQLPSVEQLVEEIVDKFRKRREGVRSLQTNDVRLNSSSFYDTIVIAGEGEPTLRLPMLLELVKSIRQKEKEQLLSLLPQPSSSSSLSLQSSLSSSLSIRVNTNGLVLDPDVTAKHLKLCGVDYISVAIMTHDPVQYTELMQPISLSSPSPSPSQVAFRERNTKSNTFSSQHDNNPHAFVCQFIREAVEVGLQVQATGVDLPQVNKELTENLVASLGVTKLFLWRTYFP